MHERASELIAKLTALMKDGWICDRPQFSKLLEDLNGINYGSTPFEKPFVTEIKKFIYEFCRYVSEDDEYLAPKCAEFIYKVCSHNTNTKPTNGSVPNIPFFTTTEWCLNVAKFSYNHQNIVTGIKGVESVIREDLSLISPDEAYSVWQQLGPLCQPENADDEILYRSLKCLVALTLSEIYCQTSKPLQHSYHMFVNLLESPSVYTRKSQMAFKILERCLIGLKNIISLDKSLLTQDLGLLLGFVKTYMVFRMDGVRFLMPERLVPTVLSVPPPPSKRNLIKVRPKKDGKQSNSRRSGQEPKLKKIFKHDPDMFEAYIPVITALNNEETTNLETAGTSDSEFSDSDVEKLTLVSQRVQQAALNFLCEAVKHLDKAVIFTYWNIFIPERLGLTHHNLITCCLNNSSYRTVMCALNALLKLLLSCKPYLSEAKVSEKASASFTPFSTVLGLSLIELHKSLCHILKQNIGTVLTQVLKCISALVQSTPYHQMPNGLVTKVVQKVKPLISHRDPSVQVTALAVMGCLLVVDPPTSEIQVALSQLKTINGVSVKALKLTKPSTSLDSFDFAHFSSSEDEEAEEADVKVESIPWLLNLCLTNLGVFETIPEKKVPAPVKLECLLILSAMSEHYLDSMILPYLGPITSALEIAFCEPLYDQIVLFSARTAYSLGNTMLRNCNNENASAFLGFWQSLLNGPLIKLVQDENYPLIRAAGCDCLSSIGSRLFQELPSHKQILCVTLLLTCSKDEDSNVRGAAIRALSLYVVCPTLRADSGFVMDTSEAILANIKDKNQGVRIKVSWALATLTDALVQPQSDCPSEPLPHELYLKFLEAGIEGAADVDQICTNAVRTLGNVLQLLDDEMLCKAEFKSATLAGLKSLEGACTSGKKAKARWNACYALASAMKNPRLYQDSLERWKLTTLPKLADTAVNFNNFKVQIGAVQALTAPARREFYGLQFGLVWKALLQSLEKCQVIDDVADFNRRDQLQEQICLGIGHLTGLLNREDLPEVELHLARYVEILKTQMRKVIYGVVPEKSTKLFNAASRLDELRVECSGTCEKRALDILTAIFQ